MSELAGKVIVFVGRLAAMPQRAAREEAMRQNAEVRRSLRRRVDYVVVGALAHPLIDSGRLDRQLATAHALGARVVSERGFLALAGLRPPLTDEPATIPLATIAGQTGLGPAKIELLAAFDVIAPAAEHVSFRDAIALRECTRLLQQGATMGAIVASALALAGKKRDPRSHPLAEVRLAHTGLHGIVVRVGEAIAGVDGQLKLPLAQSPQVGLDDLYDVAEAAEDDGDLAAAEAAYRRILGRRPADPTAAFNLANVLRDQGRIREAKLYLERAVAAEPKLAEAWYNLADIEADAGDRRAAKEHLACAIAINGEFADALFNLAQLHYASREFDRAIPLFEHYLELDSGSSWSKTARDYLAVCRYEQRRAQPKPA